MNVEAASGWSNDDYNDEDRDYQGILSRITEKTTHKLKGIRIK